MSSENLDDELEFENNEIVEDIASFDPSSIVVFSRDWTIETIFSQIMGANIDLNPKYQRRNAWSDEKRSKLIESIIIGYPVPEIVLAEDQEMKKSFAVIDGKQRLLTIAGFIAPEIFNYWDKPKISTLKVKSALNGLTYDELKNNAKYASEYRQFNNSALRCTIITNFTQNDVLYDIFYRLNSGSVTLSTQELRQVLNRGEFSNYLIDVTNDVQPIQLIMNLSGPDKRLRDIEVILRCLSMIMFSSDYKGNLKVFLDNAMGIVTHDWNKYETEVFTLYKRINECIEVLSNIFGGYKSIGRKFTNENPESRFNRVVLEVQLFFFVNLDLSIITPENGQVFANNFKRLCQEDTDFRSSLESSTKNIESYKIRFSRFQTIINDSFKINLDVNPFKL